MVVPEILTFPQAAPVPAITPDVLASRHCVDPVMPVSFRDENVPAPGAVPPIAGGDARYVPRFIAVGAITEPDGCQPRKNV